MNTILRYPSKIDILSYLRLKYNVSLVLYTHIYIGFYIPIIYFNSQIILLIRKTIRYII